MGLVIQSSAQVVQGDQTDTLEINEAIIVVHQYTTSGAATFTPPAGVTEVTYLLLAGGGGAGGGNDDGVKGTGGGGAGGLLIGTLNGLVPDSTYSVFVGEGGVGGLSTGPFNGENGENTLFGPLTAVGGGGGGTAGQAGQAGGSGGGGGGRNGQSGGAATTGQGHAGGNSTASTVTGRAAGGGGGGAGEGGFNGGASGSSPTYDGFGGDGGNGYISSITGMAKAYAAGGGGGGVYAGGTGGYGGGGNGTAVAGQDGGHGAPNTGSGGGGIARNAAGGNGGSGIVVVRYELPNCETTYSTLNEVACDSLELNGTVYHISGQYTQTLAKPDGCDSIITLNLQINNSFETLLTQSACENFTFDNQTFFESGLYEFNYLTQSGCDSTVTIDLTIQDNSASTIDIVACDNYVAPDGQEYGESGQYLAVIPNGDGCDSTITINLTMNASVETEVDAEACESYTAPDGAVYTTSGQYLAVLPRDNGCDSLITINLTILENTASTISAEACNVYTAPDGQQYTESGQYEATIPNSAGCDSVITINLTISESSLALTYEAETATPGFANGAATVTATGGTAPYTYQWNDPFMQTTATVWGVFPGYYTCEVTDAAGCTMLIEVFVPIFTGIPDTRLTDTYCNTSGYNLNDFVSAFAIPNAEAYRWEFTEEFGSTLPEYTRFEANSHIRLSWITGLDIGNTYQVRVKAMVAGEWPDEYGEVCTISVSGTVPHTEVLSDYHPNNIQGESYALCDFVVAHNLAGATNYRWRFDPDTDPGNGNEIFYVRNSDNPSLRLAWVNSLQPATTYNVAVEAEVSGTWGGFGNVHALVLADVSDQVALRTDNCSKTYSPTGVIQAESVCSADFYRFRFTPHDGGSVRQKTASNYTLLLGTLSPQLEPGTYDVDVQVQQNGVLGEFGPACPITISGPDSPDENGLPAMRSIDDEVAMGLFPNPNSGSIVNLVLEGLPQKDHKVDVAIYDGIGKMVVQDQFGNSSSQLNHVLEIENLLPGMYIVKVSIDGTQLATERLVIQ